MKRVSFQGERGAYSEAASVSFFGNEVNVFHVLLLLMH